MPTCGAACKAAGGLRAGPVGASLGGVPGVAWPAVQRHATRSCNMLGTRSRTPMMTVNCSSSTVWYVYGWRLPAG